MTNFGEMLSEDDQNRLRAIGGRGPVKRDGGCRLFHLERREDIHSVSGVGRVAEGVEFGDGVVAMRWISGTPTTVVFDCIEHVVRIHGHGGATEIVWDTPGPQSPSGP